MISKYRDNRKLGGARCPLTVRHISGGGGVAWNGAEGLMFKEMKQFGEQ